MPAVKTDHDYYPLPLQKSPLIYKYLYGDKNDLLQDNKGNYLGEVHVMKIF